MKDIQAIKSAINTLIAEGRKSYVEDYAPTRAQCIGQALAAVIDHDLLEISATALEDWNHHPEAHILRSMEKGSFNYDRENKVAAINLI
jgi:hypothetical protein